MSKHRALCMLLLGFAPFASYADEGRIPVFQPITITEPGHYIVTRDFTSNVNPAIDVRSDDVTIDLNERTIRSVAANDSIVLLDGKTNLVVRNGRLAGGRTAVRYIGTTTGGADIRIRGIEIYDVEEGIHLIDVVYTEIVSCRIRATQDSIRVTAPPGNPYVGRIVENTLVNPVQGIHLDGIHNGIVQRNIILDDLQNDWQILMTNANGCVIEQNVVTSLANAGGYNGIDVTGNDNRLVGNIVRGSGQVGILASGDRNTLEGNKVHGSAFHGVYVSGAFADVDGNHLSSNGGSCLEFAQEGGHVYRRNVLRDCPLGPLGGFANTDGGGNIF